MAATDAGARRFEAWFATLAERLPEGVLLVDDDGCVLHASPAARELLHTLTEESLQLTAGELLERLGDADRLRLEAIDERPALVIERAGPLLFVRDTNREDSSELDLLLANRMRGLEGLYRAMAHDLKSPLHAIVLNLDLVRERLRRDAVDGVTVERCESYFDVIQGELSRLRRSIQLLLSQAHPERASTRRIDLRRLQRDVVTLVRPLARRAGIEVRATSTRSPVTVVGHRDRIKQALLNLAMNAIEASGRRGALEFDVVASDGEARLEVRDDGPGIPDALRDRVFAPHFTTKTTGTGIGLGVARSVCRAHGGELDLEPREPRGTVARVRLPLAPPAGPAD